MTVRTRVRRAAWAFRREVLGLYLPVDGLCGPNPDGDQCVNLPSDWLQRWGIQGPCGSAYTWEGAEIERMRWIPYRAGLVLHAGDVAVLARSSELEFGHVAVVLDGSKSPAWTLDQNWPIGAGVSDQQHERSSMAGVQRLTNPAVGYSGAFRKP